MQTETPFWLDKAYNSVINLSDTGIMSRNINNSRIVLCTLFFLKTITKPVVFDFAGGYGILVRLLRDIGVNAFWHDPYCENLLARGFETETLKSDLITAFEAFEHFVNPALELEKMFSISNNVLISTELIKNPAPKHTEWWYYGKEHGQHVSLYRLESFRQLALKHKKYFISDGKSYHLFTDKKVNKIYWKIFMKLNRLFGPIISFFHTSKTLEDHKKFSNN